MTVAREPARPAGGAPPARGRGRHAGSAGPARPRRPAAATGGQGDARPVSAPSRVRAALAASPLTCAGLAIIMIIAVFSFGGPLFYHWDATHVHLALANRPPGVGHPLGTDADGVDILGQLMAGGQISLSQGWRRCVRRRY